LSFIIYFCAVLRIGVPISAEIKSFEPDTGNAGAGNSKIIPTFL